MESPPILFPGHTILSLAPSHPEGSFPLKLQPTRLLTLPKPSYVFPLPSGDKDTKESVPVSFPFYACLSSGSSAGKEFTCNAAGPGLIPGLGSAAGEGIGSPLQCSGASLVAQLVKSLPAMQETWVRFLGWEDALEKGKATHSSVLAWRIPWTV